MRLNLFDERRHNEGKLCGKRSYASNLADGSNLNAKHRLRELRQIASALRHDLDSPLGLCEAILDGGLALPYISDFFSDLGVEERHYWVSTLYALLMPRGRRQRLAAFFTPPHLVHHVLDLLAEFGIEAGRDRILDPASGGAAFLVPLAARITESQRLKGVSADRLLDAVETTLGGIEIEPRLAALSQKLLVDLLRSELAETKRELKAAITRASALKLEPPAQPYDAIVGNPPYGRVYRPSPALLNRFDDVITDGYVNLYAVFIHQALRWVRPGGLICFIVPTSFVGGPYFAALRKHILQSAQVLRLDLVDQRSDVFVDVLHDVCVLVLRKSDGTRTRTRTKPASALIKIDEPLRQLGYLDVPSTPSDRIWALPDGELEDAFFADGLATLGDYGYLVKTGYFVWNREQHRYRSGSKPCSNEVPLFWAHNVRANVKCHPYEKAKNSDTIGMVKIANDSSAIVRTDAILIQRTSNRRQNRRLIAGLVCKDQVPGGRGFVSENHTILVIPDPEREQAVPLKTVCRLLNTGPVDARFRRMSGSVSVSTKGLRQLPLPAAREVRAAFSAIQDDETAAQRAYERSADSTDCPATCAVTTKPGGHAE